MTTFELKPLAYAYDALEPTIDKETMMIHHDKHHQAYVNNLNKALEGINFEGCIKCLLKHLDEIPADRKQAVINNAGGHFNHEMFWESMTPGGSNQPVGELAQKIDETFGSFEAFKLEFENKGAGQFGSGWAWLVLNEGRLEVMSTPNQDCPLSEGKTPLLGNDVWEHAYYLKYKNVRMDYLKAWWSVVNWDIVEKRYQEVK